MGQEHFKNVLDASVLRTEYTNSLESLSSRKAVDWRIYVVEILDIYYVGDDLALKVEWVANRNRKFGIEVNQNLRKEFNFVCKTYSVEKIEHLLGLQLRVTPYTRKEEPEKKLQSWTVRVPLEWKALHRREHAR